MKFLDKNWKGKNYKFYVQRDKDSLWIHFQGQTWLWRKKRPQVAEQTEVLKKEGLIRSHLPGRVQKIFVKKGDKVSKGQNLLILSAMKIEYNFKAEGEGQVEDLNCQLGDIVGANQKLIQIKYVE